MNIEAPAENATLVVVSVVITLQNAKYIDINTALAILYILVFATMPPIT